MDPYMNSVVLGGLNIENKPELYSIDSFGTRLEGDFFCTAMSSYFCYSLLRELYPSSSSELSKDKALEILKRCFEVLFLRDLVGGEDVVFMSIENNINSPTSPPIISEGKFKVKGKWDFDVFKKGNENYYM